jgi:hypothetical protein
MDIPFLKPGDRFRIVERKVAYEVRKADENGDLVCFDRNELGRGRPEEMTIHCINRIPFEAIYGRGDIKVEKAK